MQHLQIHHLICNLTLLCAQLKLPTVSWMSRGSGLPDLREAPWAPRPRMRLPGHPDLREVL